jgi:uncharacterized membrane protein
MAKKTKVLAKKQKNRRSKDRMSDTHFSDVKYAQRLLNSLFLILLFPMISSLILLLIGNLFPIGYQLILTLIIVFATALAGNGADILEAKIKVKKK